MLSTFDPNEKVMIFSTFLTRIKRDLNRTSIPPTVKIVFL